MSCNAVNRCRGAVPSTAHPWETQRWSSMGSRDKLDRVRFGFPLCGSLPWVKRSQPSVSPSMKWGDDGDLARLGENCSWEGQISSEFWAKPKANVGKAEVQSGYFGAMVSYCDA